MRIKLKPLRTASLEFGGHVIIMYHDPLLPLWKSFRTQFVRRP